jgi:predicted pyridoxine 5'-phosphate oxidase superfamily flavin-nucleotide-binding protein
MAPMSRTYETIDEHWREWIAQQPMFFVGTAPLDGDGHVNVSPKGPIGTLRVLGPAEVAYLDVVGSGVETIAHLRENGRILVMLCAFEGPPRILRLHGRGEVVLPEDPRFGELMQAAAFEDPADPIARRAIVRVEVTRISDSCGYGVPLMAYEGERPHYPRSVEKKARTGGPDSHRAYQNRRNRTSIDGLPAVPERVSS